MKGIFRYIYMDSNGGSLVCLNTHSIIPSGDHSLYGAKSTWLIGISQTLTLTDAHAESKRKINTLTQRNFGAVRSPDSSHSLSPLSHMVSNIEGTIGLRIEAGGISTK